MILRYGAVASTMDLAHEAAATGAASGTAVIATEQTAGRGSRGRIWSSPPGGIWLSIVLRPRTEPAVTALSLRVGLVVAEVLESACPAVRIGLKWPNDLLVGDRKLGGILCEARWQDGVVGWVAVGIGLNVRNPLPGGLRSGAVALAESCPALDPMPLGEAIVARVAPLAVASGPLDAGEQAAFARRDWLCGRALAAPVAGTAAGVGADGSLLVRVADGSVVPVRAGSPLLAEPTGHRAPPG